ncbi:nicotinamide-nucleotide amidohydrolase family protein, partial [candidate division TA06 bacterium]|nr:nicotinamide-nucleotide amidohydrolase family protein [candidate division TA06 bacterium]
TLERVREHFEKRGMKMPSINTSQALIPRGAVPLDNPLGTAPGLWIQQGERDLILLPGVPAEMKAIFEGLLPRLKEKISGEVLLHSTLHTWGAPESEIAQRLSTTLKGKENGQVAFLPRHTGVDLRISMRGKTEREAMRVLEGLEKRIYESLGIWVWGKNEETLESVIGCLLIMKGLTLSVAESCTGGLVMDRLTGVPGSSDYFLGGLVAYSDDLKMRFLKIPKQILTKYGAVSQKTAVAMAEGIRNMAQADLGLSVTGIAGPTGGSKKKPVGLVYVGLAREGKPLWEEYRFLGDRRMIKEQSAQGALDFVRRYLLDEH